MRAKSIIKKFTITDLIAEEMARLPDLVVPEFIFHRYRYDVFPSEGSEYIHHVYKSSLPLYVFTVVSLFSNKRRFSGRNSQRMGYMSHQFQTFRRFNY